MTTAPTVGHLLAAQLILQSLRRQTPEHRVPAIDAAIFAVEQVQLALAPTKQQWRPTRRADLPTAVHAGYLETQLATRVMP